MQPHLNLITQNLQLIRNMERLVQFRPQAENGTVYYMDSATDFKLIVSHAFTTNAVDRLIEYTTGFTFDGIGVVRTFTIDEIAALPLGDFIYEFLFSIDGTVFNQAMQGKFSVNGSMYAP